MWKSLFWLSLLRARMPIMAGKTWQAVRSRSWMITSYLHTGKRKREQEVGCSSKTSKHAPSDILLQQGFPSERFHTPPRPKQGHGLETRSSDTGTCWEMFLRQAATVCDIEGAWWISLSHFFPLLMICHVFYTALWRLRNFCVTVGIILLCLLHVYSFLTLFENP